ncbi:MAG: PASTA domain-containing protein [Deinococcales bacterium]
MPSFEIPDSPATVVLKEQTVQGKTRRTGAASFSITNKTNQPLAGRLSVVPQGDAKAEWFEVMGEAQRNFAASETQQASVNVTVPGDAPAGNYTFRLRIVNVNDPDNDYTDGATASFEVPEVVTPPAHFPRWAYFAIGAALVVVVGGVVAWMMLRGVRVPDVVSNPHDYAAASAEISKVGLKPARNPTDATSGTPGAVVQQDPRAGVRVSKGSTVTLTVAAAPMSTVPEIRKLTFEAAFKKLRSNKLDVGKVGCTVNASLANRVVTQSPAANTKVKSGSTVDISMGRATTFLCHPIQFGRYQKDLMNQKTQILKATPFLTNP